MRYTALQLIGLGTFVAALVGCGSGDTATTAGGANLGQQYQNALKEADPTQRAMQLMTVAIGQHEGKDAKGAALSLRDAAKAADEVKDPLSRSGLYTQLAGAYARVGDRLEARRALRESAKVVDEIQDPEIRAGELVAIADVEGYRLKDADRGGDVLQEVEKIAETLENPKSKIFVIANAGKVYYKMGSKDDSQRLFDEARGMVEALNDPVKQVDSLNDIALALIVIRKNDEAVAALDKAAEHARKITDGYAFVFAVSNISETYFKLGQAEKVKPLTAEADKASQQIKDGALRTEAMEKVRGLELRIGK